MCPELADCCLDAPLAHSYWYMDLKKNQWIHFVSGSSLFARTIISFITTQR